MEELIRSQLWPLQLLQYEQETNVEPHARLLKVVIKGIQSQQKDPYYHAKSLPNDSDDCLLRFCTKVIMMIRRWDDVPKLARVSAMVDPLALYRVMERVEREDKIVLREVLVRARQSIRDAYLFAKGEWKCLIDILKRSLELLPNPVSASQPGSQLAFAFNAAVAAVLHLLAFVFQYLIGYVDRGGSKTFSSGAFDFRATFVSLVLFQGAYVWIKFRQAAPPSCRKRKAPTPNTTTDVQLAGACDLKGVYEKAYKDKSSGTIAYVKYEPRFTPPREEVDDGTTRRFKRLSLGEYHTRDEARIVLQIARFYYDKDEGCVELQNGQFRFFIPSMNEEERRLSGEEKRKWVSSKAKQVYADLRILKRNPEQLSEGTRTGARSSHPSDTRVLEIPSVASASEFEGPSCPSPLPPCDVVDDYCETLSGFGDMVDELLRPDSVNFLPPQSSLNCHMHYLGFGQILGDFSSPPADGVTQGIQGSIDAHLSPDFDFQQGWDLVGASGSTYFAKRRDSVLQQLVHRQKQQLEVSALRIVGLEHDLSEYQIQNSELLHENERLRTALQRFANSQMAA